MAPKNVLTEQIMDHLQSEILYISLVSNNMDVYPEIITINI